ncbi:MAG TPA: hypothetical protein VE732_06410 [Nitrososphaera sp.]|nr:hypothetical protein [Nitrososphaera sp.]
MAQIFISHSQRDERIKDLFLRAFRGTGVADIYQEYEDAPPTGVTAEIIERNIEASSALFVLLSETVQGLQHTRDWIVYECGLAKNKPIWIFEPHESFGRITVAIPRFNQYVRFRNDSVFRQYIHSIVASYNDSPLLAKLVSTTLGGLAYGPWGAAGGLALGLLAFQGQPCPPGIANQCPQCNRIFGVHIPNIRDLIRCSNCNYQGPINFLTYPQSAPRQIP